MKKNNSKAIVHSLSQSKKTREAPRFTFSKFLRDVWALSSLYLRSKRRGMILLAIVVFLTIFNSGISLGMSYTGKYIWSSLKDKNEEEFYKFIILLLVLMLLCVPFDVAVEYFKSALILDWRLWLTHNLLGDYFSYRSYYIIERCQEIDNPDQRMAEDIRTFTNVTITLFLSILSNIINTISFSSVLISIDFRLFLILLGYAIIGTGITIYSGRKLIRLQFSLLHSEADFRYSLVRIRENAENIAFYKGERLEYRESQNKFKSIVHSTWNIIYVNRILNFFQSSYIHLIQVLPTIIISKQYFANKVEFGVINQTIGAFNHLLTDFSFIIKQFESIATFVAALDRISQFIEVIKNCANKTSTSDSGEIFNTNGIVKYKIKPPVEIESHIAPTTDVICKVNSDLEFAINQLDSSYSGKVKYYTITNDHTSRLILDNLSVRIPKTNTVLIRNLNLALNPGDRLLIAGSSGTGKSSLLRSIAGLWPCGDGAIYKPGPSKIFFLPQKPYCSISTLRDQLLYPHYAPKTIQEPKKTNWFRFIPNIFQKLIIKSATEKSSELEGFAQHINRVSDEELLQILVNVKLGHLCNPYKNSDVCFTLNSVRDWSNLLSLGEQQRLAFGRLLTNSPDVIILDESTSALDPENEALMHTLILSMNKNLTLVSVGHRDSLDAFHNKKLIIYSNGAYKLLSIP